MSEKGQRLRRRRYDRDLIRVHLIAGDEKYGGWYTLCTDRQHVEVRVTPTGIIRLGKVEKGRWFPDEMRDGEE